MKKFRSIAIIAFLLIAPTVWMTKVVMDESNAPCRVCMTFNGQSKCAKAIAENQETCINTARDNACALIASGMTASIQCSQKQPDLIE